MDHIFVYVKAVTGDELIISDISCVRTNGQIGQITKKNVINAFTTKIDEDYSFKNAVKNINDNIVGSDNRFVVVTYLSDIVRPVIRNECKKIKQDELFSGRVWVDIGQLAWPLVTNGNIKDRNILTLAEHFKVKFENKEDSAGICTAIVGIYGNMMRRYQTALAGEEAIRDIGGEALENIRKIVGF